MEGACANRNARYAPQTVPSQQYTQRDMHSSAVKQEGYAQPSLTQRTPSMPLTSPGAPPSRGAEYNGDGDGDIRMEDADQSGRAKQGARSGHARLPSTQLAQEESAAARRYSPMNLSPSSPYSAGPGGASYQSYSPSGQSRLSPTRSNSYMSPNHYYASPPCKRFLFNLLRY